MNIINRIIKWPDGFVWRFTNKITIYYRKKKFNIFMQKIKPDPDEKILDIGVDIGGNLERGNNFFEILYPYSENITAIGYGNKRGYEKFKENFPKINLLIGDGKDLPFKDNSFDIGFSNAVVEHVGDKNEQKKFISEIIRVCKRSFIVTPNRCFPIELHTLLPFIHWFPKNIRNAVYKKIEKILWPGVYDLNLLKNRDLINLFPDKKKLKIINKSFLSYSLVAVYNKES